jgi:hypothetical protein
MASIIRTDALQNLNTSNIISQTNATTLTIGASGQTISIPAGATLMNNGTASGFGLTWQSVQTTSFTAVKGNAYPCNTTSAAFTVTLPATPSAGDQVQVVDYAGTFDTNTLTLNPNGNKIEGGTINLLLKGEREGVILTYIDSTQGWIATSGINEGTDALEPLTFSVNFLVIAGGAGGANGSGAGPGGGSGAGGYRSSVSGESSGGGGSAESTLTLAGGTNYTVTIGAGGSAETNGPNSVFSSITSTGGGRGFSSTANAQSGGSGGGGGQNLSAAGSGTANQGYAGGTGFQNESPPYTNQAGGGGGGAGQLGGNASSGAGGVGGNGVSSSITGTPTTRAGGGGGGRRNTTGRSAGGSGGGGDGGGATTYNGGNASVNTGSGGGAGGDISGTGGNGGSGIVIIKYPDTFTISNPGGGLTSSTATAGGFKVTSFTAGTGTIQFN